MIVSPFNFILWIITSFSLTSYLKRKVLLFRKIGTYKKFLLISIIFISLHGFISSFLNTWEVIFFSLSIVSLGISLSLFTLVIKNNLTKKGEKEMIRIRAISAESQLNYYVKKYNKK